MSSMSSQAIRLLGMNERLRNDVPGVVDAAVALARVRKVFPDSVEEATSDKVHLWLNCGPYGRFPSLSAVRPTPHTDRCRDNFYLVIRHTGIHVARPTAVAAFTISPVNNGTDLRTGPDEYAAIVAIHDAFKEA